MTEPDVSEQMKADLLRYLNAGREALLWKLDGLRDYDIRRPMTPTGTNLLGLIKHTASVEAGYLGQVFGRPFPHPLPWMDDDVGQVPWWPAERREVTLRRILVHVIAETNRHAGHADILRETIDGAVGLREGNTNLEDGYDWETYRARLEEVARQFR